ncbi:phosphotransferase family protein [Bacillus smithii]|uniref:phosphotransferase family protein n=1 Tax=Bacillus smithii TaxID=1479 RepID=UPI003D24AEEC
MSHIIPVRKGEEINKEKLEAYLRKNFKDLPDSPLEIRQFGTGASNLTYALNIGKWEAVLRRAPMGPVAPKAHDMKREHQFLSVLAEHFPLAPRPFLFCEDDSIVGKPFILMEKKEGVLIDTDFPEEIEPTPALGKRISEMMVDMLVNLHSVPYKGTILEKMTKPEGFLQRQVHGWIARFERVKTEDLPELERLKTWLVHHIPTSPEPAIIHYDYKLNNALFSEDLSKMTGLLDWEMATVGDPLADLGAAMSYWQEPDDPPELKAGFGKPSVTTLAGFYTRKEFVKSYSRKSGRDVEHFPFYLSFGYFKLAGICQQIYYRYKNGQTNDHRFARYGDFAKSLVRYSWLTAFHSERGEL